MTEGTGRMQRLVLISCSKAKLPHPAPAAALYRGDLFTKAKAWAERTGARWAVLSARYGVVQPQQVLEPYDDTLTTATREKLHAWDRMVLAQLDALARQPLTVIAGRCYRGWTGGLDVWVPLQGLGIGAQKGWLAQQLKEAA